MASHYRHYWGKNNSGTYNLQWDVIHANSFVVITASEGSPTGDTNQPGRFIVDAIFRINNIAPHEAGVTFHLEIGHYVFFSVSDGGTVDFVGWPDLLDVYTDFTVF